MKRLSFKAMEALETISAVHCVGRCEECPFQELPCNVAQIDYHLKKHGYNTLSDFIEYKEKWNSEDNN